MGELAQQVLARRRHTRLAIEAGLAGRNGQGVAALADEADSAAGQREGDESSDTSPSSPTPVIDVGSTYDPGAYLYIKEASQLERILPDLLAAKSIAVDCETTGLDPHAHKTRIVQLGRLPGSLFCDARVGHRPPRPVPSQGGGSRAPVRRRRGTMVAGVA
jgi:hypothetical protein